MLNAAATKWNFIDFRPGLVGGHCIGIDPYYLTHKCKKLGYNPEMILAGRRINDSMPQVVVERLVKAVLQRHGVQGRRRALVLGLTFKEDCPDLRNSKVLDLILELGKYDFLVDVHDPIADMDSIEDGGTLRVVQRLASDSYQLIVLTVAHNEYKNMDPISFRNLGVQGAFFADLKGCFESCDSDFQL